MPPRNQTIKAVLVSQHEPGMAEGAQGRHGWNVGAMRAHLKTFKMLSDFNLLFHPNFYEEKNRNREKWRKLYSEYLLRSKCLCPPESMGDPNPQGGGVGRGALGRLCPDDQGPFCH